MRIEVETINGLGGWKACAIFGVKGDDRTLLHHAIYGPADHVESCRSHGGCSLSTPTQTAWFPVLSRCPACHYSDKLGN